MTLTTARVIYPELPDPLTPGDLQQLFNPSFEERKWAPSVARTPASQVVLLVHLKIFQTIGRFLPAVDVPLAALEYMARRKYLFQTAQQQQNMGLVSLALCRELWRASVFSGALA